MKTYTNFKNPVLYHTSLSSNRGSIQRDGLTLTGRSPWLDINPELTAHHMDGTTSAYPKGVYLWTSKRDAVDYGYLHGLTFDVWRVDTSKYVLKEDPVTRGTFYIDTVVSPEDITLDIKGRNPQRYN